MMFDQFSKYRKWGKCNCNTMQKYSKDAHCPVKYDGKLNEYSISYGTGSIMMYYCFFCGGRLPESNRGNLFTRPSKIEMFKAFNIIRKIKTEQDIIRILDQPDDKLSVDTFPGSEIKKDTFEKGWKAQYTYSSKWKTLEIIFNVFDDGTVQGSLGGKYIKDKDSN